MADGQIFRAARARIADPIHWITGNLARDEKGAPVFPTDKTAVCFCALGALQASGNESDRDVDALITATKELFGTVNLAFINDQRGHADVLAIYDAAIAAAEAGV